MKIRIKSFNGELPSYLTGGKEYFVVGGSTPYFDIIGDCGGLVLLGINDCPHLNGGSWEIVDDNITDNVADTKYHVSPNTVVIE